VISYPNRLRQQINVAVYTSTIKIPYYLFSVWSVLNDGLGTMKKINMVEYPAQTLGEGGEQIHEIRLILSIHLDA
jgi:hypothetical protein